jgi:uncharacterized protein (TIGR02466 family)
MTVENIYPTKVYSTIVDNVDEVQNEISAIYNDIQFVSSGHHRGYANQITDIQKDAITEFTLVKTASTIDRHLRQYCDSLGFPFRPYRLYSWFTKNEPGDYLQIHHHNDVDITGTYYFQSNGEDGDFFFETPVGPAPHSLCFSGQHTRIYLQPNTGKLILFPGWLSHGVLKNTATTARVGLSFNVSFMR